MNIRLALFDYANSMACSTICSKIWGNMQQNAVQNAAKRKVKCSKTQGETLQFAG